MKALDRSLQRWRIRKALQFIPDGSYVCDIGTYDGTLFREGAAKGIHGVGVDPVLHVPEKVPPSVTLVEGLFDVGLAHAKAFDAITALAVMEHVPLIQQRELLNDVHTALCSGGLLVITVPSPLVDYILFVLRKVGAIDGQSLEQHYGMQMADLLANCRAAQFSLVAHKLFQLGLNNVIVFRKS